METVITVLLLPVLFLLAGATLPARLANSRAKQLGQLVTGLAGVECILAFGIAIAYAVSGGTPTSIVLAEDTLGSGAAIGIYFDGASSLMLALVSIVGFVVARYSIRYLDGEANQGRYFRWLGFTLGAVSLMVIAGNLVLFFVAWVMTSLGLHQLLMHYHHREAAHRAAWTKFAISRLGDAFLIAALVLIFKTFGTFEFAELFSKAEAAVVAGQITSSHVAIGWLLILGAATKSAQFPFHTWLPDTMETPTPVSALMHAGIVNAGGYLIIRMSPLVAMAPSALMALAVIGTVTACFAGIVMMTQTSIKRSLAYSTIAQMGFMMLQCGLAAFPAAMLHIVAHSLYKAHAFLSSGSVVSQFPATAAAESRPVGLRPRFAYLLAAIAATASCCVAVSAMLGIDIHTKPGGLILTVILGLAVTTWAWRLFSLGKRVTTLVALVGTAALIFVYGASYLAVDRLLEAPVVDMPTSMQFVLIGIGVGFCTLFGLHTIVLAKLRPTWLEPLRVHASNGFYIDTVYQRVLTGFAKLS